MRVDTPYTKASTITAHKARSMRRRGSSRAGEKLPWRSLGLARETSPTHRNGSRARLRSSKAGRARPSQSLKALLGVIT